MQQQPRYRQYIDFRETLEGLSSPAMYAPDPIPQIPLEELSIAEAHIATDEDVDEPENDAFTSTCE